MNIFRFRIFFGVLLSCSLFLCCTWALEKAVEQVDSEIILKEKAKKRLYPGGRDEEPLQVQAQLGAPLRKGVITEESTEPSDNTNSQDDGF
jgi:hypothetical protein